MRASDPALLQWALPAGTALGAFLLGLLAARLAFALLARVARREPLAVPFVEAARQSGTLLAGLAAAQAALQAAPDALPGMAAVRHVLSLGLIGTGTWLAMALVGAVADAVALRFPLDAADNLHARRIATQARVLTRTVATLIAIVGLALALLTFPGVRSVGAGLLASAGVIGIMAGVAAKPILGNLLAGVQIALTQPIRLDDVVIVEGEWGRIEEIARTFVVVKIWDQRRLVVPLQYFIEKPFQNWTRSSADLLGTVFLWVDYGLPLEPLRAELQRVCSATKLWDGRVALIQATDASERALQLRVLVSAADAGRAWDLRCLVREALIGYLRREWPQYLPRLRAQVDAQPPLDRAQSPHAGSEHPGDQGRPRPDAR